MALGKQPFKGYKWNCYNSLQPFSQYSLVSYSSTPTFTAIPSYEVLFVTGGRMGATPRGRQAGEVCGGRRGAGPGHRQPPRSVTRYHPVPGP